MAFLTTKDGCTLYYDVKGKGSDLLLISGLGGSASFWDAPRKTLAKHFRTISFDHRGTGRSEGARGPHTIQQVANDAIAVLDQVSAKDVSVIGHSTGGVVTQVLAVKYGQRFKRLVISGSWIKSDEKFRLLFNARRELLQNRQWSLYQNMTYAVGYPQDWIAKNKSEIERSARAKPKSLAALHARIDMLLKVDLTKATPKIPHPSLVIGAADDAIVPFHHSEEVAHAIPRSKLIGLDGGHFFPRTRTDEFLDAVLPFLEAA